MKMRSMTPREFAIIKALMKHIDIDNKREIVPDGIIWEIDEFGSISLEDPTAGEAESFKAALCSARVKDIDSIDDSDPHINIILFTRSGKVSELQIFRDDGRALQSEVLAEDLIFI